MKSMKIGLQLGYWGSGPPANAARARHGGRTPRLRLRLDGRVLRLRRPHAAGLVGLAHRARPPRHRRCASSRPARRRPPPWPRSRSTTSPAAASSSASACPAPRSSRAGTASPSPSRSPAPASTSTSCARSSPARSRSTNDGPHYPLPYPGGTGLGKPLKPIVHPLRADIPIYPRRRGAEERGARGRDRRRLVPHLLLPQGDVVLRGVARRGLRPAGRAPQRRRTSRCSPSRHGDHRRRRRGAPPTWSGRCSPSTSAAWAPRR